MMRLHQSGPRLRCLRVPTAHRLDRNLAQIRQTAAHVRDLRFDPQPSDSFKAVSPGWLRQLQHTATVQFGQSFATTHLLQSAVRRPPIQPATNATGQGTSRNSRIPADQLLNPFQYDGAKVLTANVHAPRIRGNARGVKCVPRSAGAVCKERATPPAGRSPEGRGGGRASALLPLLDDATTSPASRRLASARPALAPKCTPYFLTGPKLPAPFQGAPQPNFFLPPQGRPLRGSWLRTS